MVEGQVLGSVWVDERLLADRKQLDEQMLVSAFEDGRRLPSSNDRKHGIRRLTKHLIFHTTSDYTIALAHAI